MKINEDEIVKDLKNKVTKFNEDYNSVLKYYEKDTNEHLSWVYENAITLSLISVQDIEIELGMLEYLWNKRTIKREKRLYKHEK